MFAGLMLLVASGCDEGVVASTSASASAPANPPSDRSTDVAAASSSALPEIASVAHSTSTTAPSSASATEPTDEELEKLLEARVAAHKVQAARRLCLYRNQNKSASACPPDPKVSPHAIDKTFRARLGEITDSARKKAWQKTWERASSSGVVARP